MAVGMPFFTGAMFSKKAVSPIEGRASTKLIFVFINIKAE